MMTVLDVNRYSCWTAVGFLLKENREVIELVTGSEPDLTSVIGFICHQR